MHRPNHMIPRHRSALSSPGLCALISQRTGIGWSDDRDRDPSLLEPLADDPAFQSEWRAVKAVNKQTLAAVIRRQTGVVVDPQSLFDVQLQPLRAQMRQLLNILHVVTLYLRFTRNAGAGPPRTIIFGATATDGNLTARLIAAVASVTNHDPMVAGRLNVVLLPEMTARIAHQVCRAADLSERLSVTTSASGSTDNRKFATNGVLTIGAPVAANLALWDAVGNENFFLFGLSSPEMNRKRANGYHPRDLYESDPYLREVIDLLRQGFFCRGAYEIFQPLLEPLLTDDADMVLADYESYLACQQRVNNAYRHPSGWTRMSILNSIRAGRTVQFNPATAIDGQHEPL